MNADPSSSHNTLYDGPTRTSTLVFGTRPIRLVRPTDPDRLLDVPGVVEWNADDDYMPYWAYLWPGAYLLAEVVAQEPLPLGTDVLEIGCGLGLAGLVGLDRGWRVTFTDYDETSLGFVRRSAGANGFDPASYATRKLDWREPPDETYPVILGADVLYERRLVPMVANLLARMLAPDGYALIAGPYRVATEGFTRALARHGLRCEDEPMAACSEEQGLIRGTLYRVWRGDDVG
jgi:predicted nicotinamide N-methyase